MGKTKKGHNWKARQQKVVHVDSSEAKRIKLDPVLEDQGHYDDSNVLVLPSNKRKTTSASNGSTHQSKPLTKKQRKLLEQVVSRKKKKSERIALLENLAKVKPTAEEKALITSTSDMQSHRTKSEVSVCQPVTGGNIKVNPIAGSNRARRQQSNVEMSDSSSDSSSLESSEDEMETADASASRTNVMHQDIETTRLPANSVIIVDANVEPMPGFSSTSSATPTVRIREPCQPAVHIPLDRLKEMEDQRLQLPIIMEEQIIMEAISENPVVIIHGETGSGKTTQVPQFLYEAGYAHGEGIIGVTEPRRVAAICMAKRVAAEMNLPDSKVSYQIRYEGNATEDTKIKFMTDGVLLKELQNDEMLMKYRVIILDEAHERSVYTDVLIGWLSRIQQLRNKQGNPLNLIIMSATLRIEDFTKNQRLFKVAPPVISITTRKYQVVCHFNKRTDADYVTTAFKKVCKIHQTMPEGGILVFVTGREEVQTLCRKLSRKFPGHGNEQSQQFGSKRTEQRQKTTSKQSIQVEPQLVETDSNSILPLGENCDFLGRDDVDIDSEDSEGLDDESDADDDDDDDDLPLGGAHQRLHVLPFYSVLPAGQQAEVFKPPPANTRLCIVATNVAETSLTIPGVKYVVDTGKVKSKFFDKITGVSTFKVTWISKASAEQRAGRAGRTGKGDCYRLYSSAVYENHFEKYSPPEITRRPIEDLILQMKDLGIMKVKNFPFPTSPDEAALEAAERSLVLLGALKFVKVKSKQVQARSSRRRPSKQVPEIAAITPLGRAMVRFPIAPRYAKMLALGHQHNLLPYVVTMVAALSVPELFIDAFATGDKEEEGDRLKQLHQQLSKIKQSWAGVGNFYLLGDVTVLLRAVAAFESEGFSPEFCASTGIRFKAMSEILKLRQQLANKVNLLIPSADLVLDMKRSPPSDQQAKLLRQIVLSGLGDHIARKVPKTAGITPEEAKTLRHAYQGMLLEDHIFIHPTSVLYHANKEFVVYQSLEESGSKLYMKGVTSVEADWLPLFVPSMCRNQVPLSQSDNTVTPRYDSERGLVVRHVTSSFGPHYWPLPSVELEYEPCQDQLKWFAQFFLEGDVFSKLKPFTKHLLSPPSLMTKQWAHLQPRTTRLSNALSSKGVVNKRNFVNAWKDDPKYLLNEYCDWLPSSHHSLVAELWPPI